MMPKNSNLSPAASDCYCTKTVKMYAVKQQMCRQFICKLGAHSVRYRAVKCMCNLEGKLFW